MGDAPKRGLLIYGEKRQPSFGLYPDGCAVRHMRAGVAGGAVVHEPGQASGSVQWASFPAGGRRMTRVRTFRSLPDLVAQKYHAVFERGRLDQLEVLPILENARSLAA